MFIRRLEMFGFKSFKNKTVLEFEDRDITGIVGPNGCGKSNVVDALLWVMGENSPKHLRGGSLSDVIFGGTSKELPGNLSEVSLTLGLGDSGFPERYKNFSELMITRRVYRDEKNEYFINQQACLLRDIRELFMNTGAGCRGFSIIEQSAIEKLITAKPEDRRFIIEEVAGITKFKSRKTESMRKLDLVNQNLKRLDDILKIQESQLSQLNSQAKRAEKYRKLKQEIENRQKLLDKGEQEEIFCNYQRLIREQDSLKTQIDEKRTNIQQAKTQIEQTQNSISAFSQKVTEAQAQSAELQNKMKTLERIEGLKTTLLEDIKSKKQTLKKEEEQTKKELAQIQIFFKGQADIKELTAGTQQVRTFLEDTKQSKHSAEVSIGILHRQIQFVQTELNNLSEEKQNTQEKIGNKINEKNKANSLIKKYKQNRSALNKDMEVICKNNGDFSQAKEKIEKEIQQAHQTVTMLFYKIEEMNKLISKFETTNEVAQDLLKNQPEEFQSLFKNLTVDPDYAIALDAVLGHHIQALVSKDNAFIERAVQQLKDKSKGKASFLSTLPVLAVSDSTKKEIKNYPSFICFLDEKIKWNLYIEPLKPLLEQTVVVSNLSSAFELKKEFPAFQFITKEGDLITRDSIVYAGSCDKETSLFQIRAQIDKYSKELSAKETELKVKKMDLESCLKKLTQAQEQKQKGEKSLAKISEQLVLLDNEIEYIDKDMLRLSDMREANNKRAKDFEREHKNLAQHEDAYNKEIKKLEEIISFKEASLKKLEENIEQYTNKNVRKTKLEASLLENSRVQQNLNQELSRLLKLINPSGYSEFKKADEFNLTKTLDRIQQEKQNLKDRLISSQTELGEFIQKKQSEEQKMKGLEQQVFQLKLDINNLESDGDKKELEKNYLKNQFLEKYQLQIEKFESSPQDIPLGKLKEEIEQYNKQLDRIKEVNFLALEEYEKLSKDNLFLCEQREDMVHSKKEIMKVISHIDKLCKTRFEDMLEEINKRFSKVFPVIFQGENAKAQLILLEDPGTTEPGVDILIQPPGKRPQSVSLLSKGEKALTSICLIYSLFLVKPSPFCIIDEADAPLDDANILRFLSVLKEMSKKSQIIAITHNKYTMQACRKLYGVTMERPGISQVVSVDRKKSSSLTERSLI